MVMTPFKSIRFWTATLAVILAFLIVYLFFGFSTLNIQASPSSSIYINDTLVLTGSGKVKLRPGNYKVSIISRDIEPTTKSYSLLAFSTKNITQVSAPLNFEKIINTALGANEGTYKITNSRSFDSYYAASVSSLNQDKYVVLKFYDGSWGLLYEGRGEEPTFQWSTPASVYAYLKGIKLDANSQ